MRVNYKREMNHNYLMIEAECRETSYEARMMVNNFIEGLLKFRIKKIDTHCCFCYEITSRQPLSRLLENRSLGMVELQMMVVTIARTLNRMEEYLLKENQILMEPEYIYVEPDLFQVEFCLIPGRQGDFPQEFSKLLEYLLGKVDYQDQDCVVLAYGLYRESLKENYGMEDLLRLLSTVVPAASPEDTEEVRVQEEPVQERNLESRISEHNAELHERWKKEPEEVIGWWKGWRRRIARIFQTKKKEKLTGSVEKKENERGRQTEGLPWQMIFEEEEEEKPKPELNPEPEMAAEEGTNTILLADRREQVKMHRLVSAEKDEPDICIAYYPFIIGKQENLVDYILNKDTVSRLHLRLDEKDGNCWITDLNSTNGTTVAGYLLENNEIVQVNIGDEVVIAGFRYKFV